MNPLAIRLVYGTTDLMLWSALIVIGWEIFRP